jgi:hypothetical protein
MNKNEAPFGFVATSLIVITLTVYPIVMIIAAFTINCGGTCW